MHPARLIGCPGLLCLALLGLTAAPAQALGTVQLTLSTGWVTGSITGLTAPWPFHFRLDGSFSDNSQATIEFDDFGAATLTVIRAASGPVRHYAFDFGATQAAPTVTLGGSRFVAPQLQTLDEQGAVLQSVLAQGASGGAGTPEAPAAETVSPPTGLPVPEPSTGLLWLAGLAALPWLARRRPA